MTVSLRLAVLAALLALGIAVSGCSDSSDDSTTSTTSTTSTAAQLQPKSAKTKAPSAADDRKDARQNIGRIADGLKDLNRYAADFDEVAPVRAANGDKDAAIELAQTTIAALGSLDGVLVFDSPAAADSQQAALKGAIKMAKQKLEQVGKGSDLTGDVEQAKKALDNLTTAANALTQRLGQIASGTTG